MLLAVAAGAAAVFTSSGAETAELMLAVAAGAAAPSCAAAAGCLRLAPARNIDLSDVWLLSWNFLLFSDDSGTGGWGGTGGT